jgi:hypothetical protein
LLCTIQGERRVTQPVCSFGAILESRAPPHFRGAARTLLGTDCPVDDTHSAHTDAFQKAIAVERRGPRRRLTRVPPSARRIHSSRDCSPRRRKKPAVVARIA